MSVNCDCGDLSRLSFLNVWKCEQPLLAPVANSWCVVNSNSTSRKMWCLASTSLTKHSFYVVQLG